MNKELPISWSCPLVAITREINLHLVGVKLTTAGMMSQVFFKHYATSHTHTHASWPLEWDCIAEALPACIVRGIGSHVHNRSLWDHYGIDQNTTAMPCNRNSALISGQPKYYFA